MSTTEALDGLCHGSGIQGPSWIVLENICNEWWEKYVGWGGGPVWRANRFWGGVGGGGGRPGIQSVRSKQLAGQDVPVYSEYMYSTVHDSVNKP